MPRLHIRIKLQIQNKQNFLLLEKLVGQRATTKTLFSSVHSERMKLAPGKRGVYQVLDGIIK